MWVKNSSDSSKFENIKIYYLMGCCATIMSNTPDTFTSNPPIVLQTESQKITDFEFNFHEPSSET